MIKLTPAKIKKFAKMYNNGVSTRASDGILITPSYIANPLIALRRSPDHDISAFDGVATQQDDTLVLRLFAGEYTRLWRSALRFDLEERAYSILLNTESAPSIAVVREELLAFVDADKSKAAFRQYAPNGKESELRVITDDSDDPAWVIAAMQPQVILPVLYDAAVPVIRAADAQVKANDRTVENVLMRLVINHGGEFVRQVLQDMEKLV